MERKTFQRARDCQTIGKAQCGVVIEGLSMDAIQLEAIARSRAANLGPPSKHLQKIVKDAKDKNSGNKKSNSPNLAGEVVFMGNRNIGLRDAVMTNDVRSCIRYLTSGAAVGHMFEVTSDLEDSIAIGISEVDKKRFGIKARVWTCLHYAAFVGFSKICAELLKFEKAVVDIPDSVGMTALHYACASNQATITQLLLDAGASVDAVDKFGMTPLQVAAAKGNAACARHLLEFGATIDRVDFFENAAIHFASSVGSVAMIRLLLEEKGSMLELRNGKNETPLLAAFAGGHADATQFLLKAGSQLDVKTSHKDTPLHLAVASLSLDTVMLLCARNHPLNVKNEAGNSPLHLAALCGAQDIVRVLTERSALVEDLNGMGESPLHLAASVGSLDAVKSLCGVLANVNALDISGCSPLLKAVSSGSVDTVAYLIKQGADIHINCGHWGTPIHLAASRGNPSMLKYLLEVGCEKELLDSDGNFPISKAIIAREWGNVVILLKAGCSVRKRGDQPGGGDVSAGMVGGVPRQASPLVTLVHGYPELDWRTELGELTLRSALVDAQDQELGMLVRVLWDQLQRDEQVRARLEETLNHLREEHSKLNRLMDLREFDLNHLSSSTSASLNNPTNEAADHHQLSHSAFEMIKDENAALRKQVAELQAQLESNKPRNPVPSDIRSNLLRYRLGQSEFSKLQVD